jgi:hypothetical protein
LICTTKWKCVFVRRCLCVIISIFLQLVRKNIIGTISHFRERLPLIKIHISTTTIHTQTTKNGKKKLNSKSKSNH